MARHWAIRRREASGTVSFNMTPMIDCTFQLIIFFVLGGQIASSTLASVELHRPRESQAVPTERLTEPRAIVSVLAAGDAAAPGAARCYEIDGRMVPIGDADQLADILAVRKTAVGGEEFCVEIRADHRVAYGQIEPIIDAARRCGISELNMTALMGRGL